MRYKRLINILLVTGTILSLTACVNSTENTSSSNISDNVVSINDTHDNTDNVSDNSIDILNQNEAASGIIDNFSETSTIYDGNIESLIKTIESMSSSLDTPINVTCTEVSPGELEHFTEEITGFSKAIKFRSVDKDILFDGYVFEVKDTTDIVDFSLLLSAKSNLDWNKYGDDARLTITNNGTNLVLYVIHS